LINTITVISITTEYLKQQIYNVRFLVLFLWMFRSLILIDCLVLYKNISINMMIREALEI
jgi:hypothetical protein